MADLDLVLEELVTANRILAHEGVVDGFGHVTVRHPQRPDRFLMSRAWKGFPRGNTARYLQLDAGVVSHLNEIFEGNRACKCIDLHL